MTKPLHIENEHTFDHAKLLALSSGKLTSCFGDSHKFSQTHSATPNLAFEVIQGVITSNGKFRAVLSDAIQPDDPSWCHRVARELLAFYMLHDGLTITRDGYQFALESKGDFHEPINKNLQPTQAVLQNPRQYATSRNGIAVQGDVVFYHNQEQIAACRDAWLELAPNVLLRGDALRADATDLVGSVAAYRRKHEAEGTAHPQDNLVMGPRNILTWCIGDLVETLGPDAEGFEGDLRLPRPPSPPILMMSRFTDVQSGNPSRSLVGQKITAEYDIRSDDWYFQDGANDTMPFALILEAALQPFSLNLVRLILADAQKQENPVSMFVRNLDGTCRIHEEIRPCDATVTVTSEMTSVSRLGNTSITSFSNRMTLCGRTVFEIDTVFGLLTADALAGQAGMQVKPEEMFGTSPYTIEPLTPYAPDSTKISTHTIPTGRMRLLDRIVGYSPQGGRHNLGYIRGEIDVNTDAWYFKAHFFQDPVMPGSLGLESIQHLLHFFLRQHISKDQLAVGRFSALHTPEAFRYKYRGQVLPHHQKVTVEAHIKHYETTERGLSLAADAAVWVDGTCIYKAWDMGTEFLAKESTAEVSRPSIAQNPDDLLGTCTEATTNRAVFERTWSLTKDPWLRDHCPTFVVPTLPFAVMVQIMTRAAQRLYPEHRVVGLRDVVASSWLAFEHPSQHIRVIAQRTELEEPCKVRVTLYKFRHAARKELSRFESFCEGFVTLSGKYAKSPTDASPVDDGHEIPLKTCSGEDLYRSAYLFAGDEFQVIASIAWFPNDRRLATVNPTTGCPYDALLLLSKIIDGAAQAVPHYDMYKRHEKIRVGSFGLPYGIEKAQFFTDTPSAGPIHVDIRFVGFGQNERFPTYDMTIFSGPYSNTDVWAKLRWTEVLVDPGFGTVSPFPTEAIRRYAVQHDRIENYLISKRYDANSMTCSAQDIRGRDTIPGTAARIFLETNDELRQYHSCSLSNARLWLARQAVVKELVAESLHTHPAKIILEPTNADVNATTDDQQVTTRSSLHPLTQTQVAARRADNTWHATLTEGPRVNFQTITDYWRHVLGDAGHAIEPLGFGLVDAFLGQVILQDTGAHAPTIEEPCIYLANHQTFSESVIFNTAISALYKRPITFLAKTDHQQRLLGKFTDAISKYPGIATSQTILYVERSDPNDILRAMNDLRDILIQRKHSVCIHVEGRRSYCAADTIAKLSSVWIDLCTNTGAPIVPVRFSGALPETNPDREKFDFPMGYGKQDFYMGTPITADELNALTYGQRAQTVLDRINSLGSDTESRTLPSNPALMAEVQQWQQQTGADEGGAVVYVTTRAWAGRPIVRRDRKFIGIQGAIPALVYAGEWFQQEPGTVQMLVKDDDEGRWLQTLGRWFFGAHGPKVVTQEHLDVRSRHVRLC